MVSITNKQLIEINEKLVGILKNKGLMSSDSFMKLCAMVDQYIAGSEVESGVLSKSEDLIFLLQLAASQPDKLLGTERALLVCDALYYGSSFDESCFTVASMPGGLFNDRDIEIRKIVSGYGLVKGELGACFENLQVDSAALSAVADKLLLSFDLPVSMPLVLS